MGTRYRVIVEQLVDVDGAQYETTDTILFETVSPSALALLRYAPTEVDAALREAAGLDEFGSVPQRIMFGIDSAPAGVTATVFNAAGEIISPAVAASTGDTVVVTAPTEPVAEPVKPKRTRRTKAEIAADRLREAAEQHAADASATAQVGEAADTVVEQVQAARWPSADEVAANVRALDTVDAPEPVVEQAPAAPTYSPFGTPSGQGASEQTGTFANPFLGK